MDACHFLLIVLVASILHVAYATAATTSANLTADAAATAYDILEKNNLPRGLLPKGVQSYNLSPDGKFEVTLPGECDFPVTFGGQDFKFRFASTVGGVIQAGSIHEVYGVRVQIKFGWLGLRQVDRAGDQLTLQVQQFTQTFPTSTFAVSPSCS
uniref:Xylanase inhibitor C-terminal domain-containing protein n=1 Tax=Setaria italica TaxID=4555 RepID=K3YL61_SETIT